MAKPILFSVVFYCLALCGISLADDAQRELEKLQGKWIIVSAEINGKPVETEYLKDIHRTVKGDEVTWDVVGDVVYRTRFKLDLTHKPMRWDITFLDGDEQGQTRLGIYEWQGDELNICMAGPNSQRPTEFVTQPKSEGLLLVLRRE